MDDLAEFLNLETGLGREPLNVRADLLDRLLGAADEILPAAVAELGDAQQPFRIELRIMVILQKILARDAAFLGVTQELRLESDEPLVDVIELLDQRIDAVLIEARAI